MPGPLLKVQTWFCVAGLRDSAPCQKWAKREGFVAFPRNNGRRGTLEEDLERCISRGRRSTRDMFIRHLRGGALISWEGLHFGASDLQVCWDDFAWQVQHFVWPGTTFAWQAQHFTQMEWKNRKTHWYEAVSSALNFPCLKEISQNCFILMVNFENGGSLTEFLRFWRCQVKKNEEVSKNCFVFDVVKLKIEEISQNSFVFNLQIDRQTDR